MLTLTTKFADGLRFRVLQETDGSRHLKVFWQDIDITDVSNTMKDLIRDHELHQIFELRAVTVIMGIIQQQLEQLISTQNGDSVVELASTEVYQAISQLRSLETSILQKSIQVLDEQVRLNSTVYLDAYSGMILTWTQHVFPNFINLTLGR